MTILPKKKVEQKEEGERESSDHQHSHGGVSHGHRLSGGAEARGARPRGPVAPTGEAEPSDCGPSLSKRRHRASPHRSCRKSHRASHGAGATAAAASPRSDEAEGYNSDDEHGRDEHDRAEPPLPEPGFCEQGERRFEKVMKEKNGFIIKRMSEDGACLFRAAADQVYGDQDMHDVVRKHCMDYLVSSLINVTVAFHLETNICVARKLWLFTDARAFAFGCCYCYRCFL
uniref:OTU domain-containing protein 5-A-like n=1 Tax=Myxine glutinosa TaxID=7769 RepID=UPI00358DF5F9